MAISNARGMVMKKNSLSRRSFLQSGASTVASLLVGCHGKLGNHELSSKMVETGTQPVANPAGKNLARQAGENSSSIQVKGNSAGCSVTSSDITGPYWRKGIPIRNHFDLYGHSGQKLTLSGMVRTRRCEPIANAVIEMWHASPTTVPASELTRKDTVDYDMTGESFRYYGQFATDAKGAYVMTTMKPGWYLNGPTFRPSHIHAKLYVDGVEQLTTQLYFQNDRFIATDPWASTAPERAIKLEAISPDHLKGRFDFTV